MANNAQVKLAIYMYKIKKNVQFLLFIVLDRNKQLLLSNIIENLVEGWYSLEQYNGFEGRTSFHPLLWISSGLTGSWKLSAYIRFGSLRSVKVLKLMVKEAKEVLLPLVLTLLHFLGFQI